MTFPLRRAVSLVTIAATLTGCSIGGLMTSFSIDTSDKDTEVVTRSDEAKQGPADSATPAPALASQETPEPPASIEQLIAETETEAGVPIDSYLGVSTKDENAVVAANAAVPAAPVTRAEIQAEMPDPGIDPIKTASLRPPTKPGAVTGKPPKNGRLPGLMPLAERQCRSSLKQIGVTFEEVAEIANGGHCGITYPVKLQSLSGKIAVSPNVTVNCQTALAFAEWVENDVAPAVRVRYLTGLKSVNTMGGYSCRRVNNGTKSRAWSEHAEGNAIDVGGFTLNTGKTIDVSSKGFFAFREKGLLKSVRASGCAYFNTVLGPGYPKHHDHLHFDLKQRSSGRSYCK